MISTSQPVMQDKDILTRKIAKFWDQISPGWLKISGIHIHHGFYESNFPVSYQEAQDILIEKLVTLLSPLPQANLLDVGCGMGGTSLHLAKNHQLTVKGISLSSKQIAMATRHAQIENILNTSFKVDDALSLTSCADNSFDIVWSLESCEQFFDKKLFLQQAHRVLKPNGKLLLATWCSNAENYVGKLAKDYLKLCHAFDVPYMPTIAYYNNLLTESGFNVKKSLDWTDYVKNSWQNGLSLLKAYHFLQILKMGGWRGFRFAQQIKLMRDAFQYERIRYGVFLAEKI